VQKFIQLESFDSNDTRVAGYRPHEDPNRLALASSDGSPWLASSSHGDWRMAVKRKLQAGRLYANTKRRDNKTVAVTNGMLITSFFLRTPARSAIHLASMAVRFLGARDARDFGKGPREPSTKGRRLEPAPYRCSRGRKPPGHPYGISRTSSYFSSRLFSLSLSLSLLLVLDHKRARRLWLFLTWHPL